MKILPGELVTLDINKAISPENLVLAPIDENSIKLYEKIDLNVYPSCDDFKGYNRSFKNEILLVVEKKGRPASFSKRKQWDLYDVYYVIYANKTYECFSYCMKKITI